MAERDADSFHGEVIPVPLAGRVQEQDPHRLSQRQKQIDYGKNTSGYARYRRLVPVDRRRRRGAVDGEGRRHPRTPDVHQQCSKRSWMGQLRKWRQDLHDWDENSDATRNVQDHDEDNHGRQEQMKRVRSSHEAATEIARERVSRPVGIQRDISHANPASSSGQTQHMATQIGTENDDNAQKLHDDDDDEQPVALRAVRPAAPRIPHRPSHAMRPSVSAHDPPHSPPPDTSLPSSSPPCAAHKVSHPSTIFSEWDSDEDLAT